MRFKDVVIPVPSHLVLNNNQLQQSSFDLEKPDEVKNRNAACPTVLEKEKKEVFQVAQDTSTWSSIANTRANKNFDFSSRNNINNSFPVATLYQSSSTESLADYEGSEDPSHESSPSDWSDWSDEGNVPPGCRGIVNPNYPGFHHLGPSLLSDTDLTEDELETCDISQSHDQHFPDDGNEFNNNIEERVAFENINQLDGNNFQQKIFYDKPKFNIHNLSSLCEQVVTSSEKCMNYVKTVEIIQNEEKVSLPELETIFDGVTDFKLNESLDNNSTDEQEFKVQVEIVELMTSVKETLQFPEIEEISDSIKTNEISESEDVDLIREAKELSEQMGASIPNNIEESGNNTDSECYSDENQPFSKLDEIDLLSSIGRDIGVDLEKYVQPIPDLVAMKATEVEVTQTDTNKMIFDKRTFETPVTDLKKREKMVRNQAKRRQQAHSGRTDKRRTNVENITGDFDVYNIETAMPKIDLDAIETHLRAAREEERRRRNDREEIRKRLAMGTDADEHKAEKVRKPSLQSRLQNGMNLQICFMNEASSDTESPSLENENLTTSSSSIIAMQNYQIPGKNVMPQVLNLPPLKFDFGFNSMKPIDEADFFARQARLQMEARIALSQAKEMAHMQVEVERQKLKHSPITEMVRSSLAKIGVQLGEERRRLSRMLLTELNVAQLQVLANDLHARIATLNETLVEGLLRRDDLHMEQDSMLVDVEDLTRYLGAKQESLKKRQTLKGETVSMNQKIKNEYIPNASDQQLNDVVKSSMNNPSLIKLVTK